MPGALPFYQVHKQVHNKTTSSFGRIALAVIVPYFCPLAQADPQACYTRLRRYFPVLTLMGNSPRPLRGRPPPGGGLGQARFSASLSEPVPAWVGGVTALAVTEGVRPSGRGGRQENFSATKYTILAQWRSFVFSVSRLRRRQLSLGFYFTALREDFPKSMTSLFC